MKVLTHLFPHSCPQTLSSPSITIKPCSSPFSMSMNDYDYDIDLFLTESNAFVSSLYREPPILCFDKETMINHMESKISIFSSNASSHMETSPSTNSQLSSIMATPSLPSTSLMVDPANNIGFTPVVPFETANQTPTYFNSKSSIIEQPSLPLITQKFPMTPKEPPSTYFQSHVKNPTDLLNPKEQLPSKQFSPFYFPSQNFLLNLERHPPQGYIASQNILLNDKEQLNDYSSHYPHTKKEKDQLPGEFHPPTYINAKVQSSEMPYRPSNLHSNFVNAMNDLLSHDQEAVSYFLAGQVRPGQDVTQIYKCSECSMEFPNAQAFGGHMSSHSKGKKRKNSTSTVEGNSKRSKYSNIKASSSHSSKTKSRKKASTTRGEMTEMKSARKEIMENEGVQKEHGQVVQEIWQESIE